MMNFSSKPALFTQLYTLLLVVFTSILTPFQITLCATSGIGILCHEAEMQALLSFKQTLGDPYNILSSWKPQVDCCRWGHLNCSKLSGHVLQLHLQNGMDDWFVDDGFELPGFNGTLNPSLLNLTQLTYLDLSRNNFEGKLPAFIGSLSNLEHLNLSLSGFDANLPHTIGNLSNLRILSYEAVGYGHSESLYFGDVTRVESMDWLSSLSHLEHLDMSYVNLSQVYNWLQVINTLPSLLEIIFRGCWLNSFTPSNLSQSSSFNLARLRHLDLSANRFEGELPAFIGSFTGLEHLDLSASGFQGSIPSSIGNLWHLKYLDLTYSNLSEAVNWSQIMNELPSLVELHLDSCSLDFISPLNHKFNVSSSLSILHLVGNNFKHFPEWILQLNNLTYLDLSENDFAGMAFPCTSNITKLRHINLSGNNFNSSIPNWFYYCKSLEYVNMRASFRVQGSISNAIGNLTSLTFLDLSSNELSNDIPSEISKLCKLQHLDLSTNKLHGDISNFFGNISCFKELREVYLSDNMFSGNLNDQFGEFIHLRSFLLGNNSMSGPIPTTLGRSLSLEELDLGDNNFTGNFPMSFGHLSNLLILHVGYNSLEGFVNESHFANLTSLLVFDASGNHLTLRVDSNWTPPFLELQTLRLRSWNLGSDGKIPTWFEKLKNPLIALDLSGTGVTGHVPSLFWEIPYLSLSHNQLYGNIADIRINSQIIYLNSNHFSGLLPQLGSTVTQLDLSDNSFSGGISFFSCDTENQSYNIKILNLGRNLLSAKLPDCWMRYPSLQYLNLGNNNLSGTIPNSIGLLDKLQSLSLNNNNLSGEIPSSIQNCTRLVKVDLDNNMFAGNLPSWIGTSLVNLTILSLSSNNFSGRIPPSICNLKFLQILDLSKNNFFGVIPGCVNNFTGMGTKRQLILYRYGDVFDAGLAYTHSLGNYIESASVTTKGSEYQYDTILSLVTSIDLSNNNLCGEIPNQLTSLVELRSLNLSNNHLNGSVPVDIGNMHQLESLDLSRNFLSGGIPNSLASISSLENVNLSCNNLTGKVPESTQLQGFPASSFTGNNLCGAPLPKICSSNDGRTNVSEENKNQRMIEVEWMYVFVSLGYAVGISVVLATLILKKSWRDAYFGSMENLWDKFYFYCKRC